MNVFAGWRLVLLVMSETSVISVIDGTWYAASTILLAALEVSLASICASIPIFWPILSQHFGNIFVTQEVVVIHEDRDVQPGSAYSNQTELSTHYKDDFVVDRVDPLRPHTSGGVETHVRSESVSSKKKKRG